MRSRFAQWDRLVRRPLLWLGIADPLDTQAELRGGDPVRETLLAILNAWSGAFSDTPTTVNLAIKTAKEHATDEEPALLEALQGAAVGRDGSINSRKLGRYLMRHVRRIEGGMRLETCGSDPMSKRNLYQVKSAPGVSGVSGVIPNPTREMAGKNIVMNSENTDYPGNTVLQGTPQDDIPF